MNVKLNNNTTVPIIGLGTWQSRPNEVYDAVLQALEAGYRHIDTAAIYGNEEEIGKAIKDSGVKREELFVTTKLWNTDQGYESALKAFDLSLKKLQLEYVDLYLIHWFKGYEKQLQSWKALEEIYKSGRAKAIGVSNHNVHHIENILKHCEIKPMVNQVETHVTLQNWFLQEYCESVGVKLEAYAPMMSWKIKDLLENDELILIAKKYKKTVPQIALRFLVERGIIIIPKSVNKDRIKQNFDIFDFALEEADFDRIKGLNTGKKLFTDMDNVPY